MKPLDAVAVSIADDMVQRAIGNTRAAAECRSVSDDDGPSVHDMAANAIRAYEDASHPRVPNRCEMCLRFDREDETAEEEWYFGDGVWICEDCYQP